MAESDFDLKLDEMERDNLQRTISEIERARAAARPDARSFFETFLLNARGRVAQLDKKIKDSQEGRENHAREQAAIAALAQKESALSAREKEKYSGFLKEDFFTKKDFGRLEQFYGSAWDRLSESGKAQMSHRIWEGIRHGEYTFDQLPPKVREKEMERVYELLHKRSAETPDVSKIPEKDRADFIRAYEAGKRDEAEKVLERDSFKRNMFQSSESAARSHAEASRGRESERSAAVTSVERGQSHDVQQKAPEGAGSGGKDLSKFALDGVQLVETDSQGTSADIPNRRTAVTRPVRSAPGS